MDRDDFLLRQEEIRNTRTGHVVGTCAVCKKAIFGSDDYHEGQEFIRIDEGLFHWDDCWTEYGWTHRESE